MTRETSTTLLKGMAPKMPWPCVAVAGLFIVSGAGFWNNILLFPKIAAFFGIDLAHAHWIQSLYSIGYIASAFSSAAFHRKFGYKIGIVFSLSLVAIGPFLIYPALAQKSSIYFLLAVMLVGAGWSSLETSLNPLAIDLGRPETAVRRLNLLQSFFPIGLVIGYLVGRWCYPSDLHLSYSVLAATAAKPYIAVGLFVLLLAFLVERVGVPAKFGVRDGGVREMRAESRSLLTDRSIRIGIIGIFCCVAVQSTLQGLTYMYVVQQYEHFTYELAENITLVNLVIFGIGRFAASFLMTKFDPHRLLLWCATMTFALAASSYVIGGACGLVCLMATNIFVGMGFPTIFATTVGFRRSHATIASGLLVGASGLSGLLIPIATNYLIGATSARASLLLVVPFFLGLLVFARHAIGRKATQVEN